MGDRVGERLQVLVRLFKFSRALYDAVFEFRGERADQILCGALRGEPCRPYALLGNQT